MSKNVTTLTLSGRDAERLDRIVQSGGFQSAEAAVSEALSYLEDSSSPELDAWLREVVTQRYDDYVADPSKTMSLEEARRRLFGPTER